MLLRQYSNAAAAKEGKNASSKKRSTVSSAPLDFFLVNMLG